MDLTRRQAHLNVLRQLSGVRSRRMLGEWTEPVCLNQQPVKNGIHSCFPEAMVVTTDGQFLDWGSFASMPFWNVKPPFFVPKCPLQPLSASFDLCSNLKHRVRKQEPDPQFHGFRNGEGFEPGWNVGHSDARGNYRAFSNEEGDDEPYVVRIHLTNRNTLVIQRQANQHPLGTIELHEPVERVWWLHGPKDQEANLGVQTATGIHVLGIFNKFQHNSTKTQKNIKGYAACVSSTDHAPSSLIRSEKWDDKEHTTNGPFSVRYLSSLSFATVDVAFPSRTEEEEEEEEEEEAVTHDNWIMFFAGTSKRDLLLQPPRSNRLIYVECVRDRECTYAARVVDGLQMKGVRQYWCQHNIGYGGKCIYVFALHRTGYLLTWRFDSQTNRFQAPVLVSQPCVPEHTEHDKQTHLHVQYVKTQGAQTIVYYTRSDQQHVHLWTSTLTYPKIEADNCEGQGETAPNKKQKCFSSVSSPPSAHRTTQRIEKIRSMFHAFPRVTHGLFLDHLLFLLPELLQNAVAWKYVYTQSPTPSTHEAYQPYCQFLGVFDTVLTDVVRDNGRFPTVTVPAGGIMREPEEQLWFENALQFLQDVRSPRALLRKNVREDDDLGLSFVAWKPFRLGQNNPTLKALVEWVEQSGIAPPRESDEEECDEDDSDEDDDSDKEEEIKKEKEKCKRLSCTLSRLCMRLVLDLDCEYLQWKRFDTPWEPLNRCHPVVWQMVLGDMAYVHMKHFFEKVFAPGTHALSTCIQTMTHANLRAAKSLQNEGNGRNIVPGDLLRDVKENMECCEKVFRAVVRTKAECWIDMTMYADQDENLFTALFPKELRQLCEEIDLRMYYFLCYGDHGEGTPFSEAWQDLLVSVPLPSCAEEEDLKWEDDGWQTEWEDQQEQKQKERQYSLVSSFKNPSDQERQILSDWKKGKLGTGTFLDEWYDFFRQVLPVECLMRRHRLGRLFPTFTHLYLMGDMDNIHAERKELKDAKDRLKLADNLFDDFNVEINIMSGNIDKLYEKFG